LRCVSAVDDAENFAEIALARALVLASEGAQWSLVATLLDELRARRLTRGGTP
jgi:hypothetical protein